MTLDDLTRLRLAGQRPAGDMYLVTGTMRLPVLSECTICIPDGTPIARLDLRPLLGLNVVLFVECYSEAAGALFERLKSYAESVVFLVDAWLDTPEAILVWVRGKGQKFIAEPWEATS